MEKGNERFDREQAERKQAWDILQNIPEFIADRKKASEFNKIKDQNKIKQLKKKWGFYPLEDILEFTDAFSKYSVIANRWGKAVDFHGVDMFSLNASEQLVAPEGSPCKGKSLLHKIDVTIDITRSDSAILDELRTGIDSIRRIFKTKITPNKKHDHLEFLIGLLIGIGLTDAEIHERLTPRKLLKLAYDHGQRKSHREKIQERLKTRRKKV